MNAPAVIKHLTTALDNLLAAQVEPEPQAAAALESTARERVRAALVEMDASTAQAVVDLQNKRER